jgi:DeoR/GlpR family transcriptional regulator of sugar metabolism
MSGQRSRYHAQSCNIKKKQAEKLMLSGQRKQAILTLLASEKQVQSRDLSQRFGVSEDSVRRDLREMAAEGLLQSGSMAVPCRFPLRWRDLKHAKACKPTQNGQLRKKPLR